MTTVAGYVTAKVEQSGLDEDTAWKIKFALIVFQVVGLLLAIAIMLFYPITRWKVAET